MSTLTKEEQTTNAETFRHILTVRALLLECVRELVNRADAHDVSKLGHPEVDTFVRRTPILAGLTYGSPEYKACVAILERRFHLIQRHNPHHPEYHPSGIEGMDLFDVLEMVLDWKGATLRHKNGDIRKSLEINTTRFNLPPAIVQLISNTLPKVEEMTKRSRVAISYPHVE